ncbi:MULTISPECIES: acyl-CoA dehydrogenase family protein [unclassified Corallococcus]|uniref:acyl-CoA dehydrogenase family protein n=1 Tax=unclassified Corallococcus TaxID=2685029 RepID=UPI000EA1DF27|nr:MULTISPECIES: acyl-CoA dehydrogenase family protein [unclassified Corallococcus]NOJ97653.1 acyl-CoA dehydrogenase [Corallococcus coralloides]MBN9682957.1 acyl-CoA dehydrogenase family protein [Corallococcus sp. NCSPR001]RKG51085.1 acyl-CoA dehydrogenase [Corallococcus sp. AB011P]RKG81510.1 acyl-CoA dehydrogenase [Corallococcus sp. CA049B]RKH88338.1 acyl-CoA dehydrogenase [Corallococcus sp. AB045]
MDFQLSENQRALQDAARKYARDVVRPKAPHYDETSDFPKDLISAAFELGLLNMAIPSEYNGVGLTHLEQVIVCEELAWGCAGVATSLIANDLANLPIILHGTDDQKKRLLAPFGEKLKLSCFCLTEPAAGSDVAAMGTTARREGDEYVLNGSKCFITNAGYADQFTVFATLDKGKKHKGITCFVVEGRPQGLTTGKHENKMGQRASNTTTVTFDEVRVPVANRIGEEGEGFKIAMATLDNSRPLTASISIGIARAALEHSLEYSAQRQTMGKPIREHQAVQFMLAEMAMNTHAARLLTYESAQVLDEGQRNTLQSSYAKCFAADMAMKVATDAVQVFGGYGYMKEYPVEKLMRDAKLIQVYEGTSQVQRLVIAKELFR